MSPPRIARRDTVADLRGVGDVERPHLARKPVSFKGRIWIRLRVGPERLTRHTGFRERIHAFVEAGRKSYEPHGLTVNGAGGLAPIVIKGLMGPVHVGKTGY